MKKFGGYFMSFSITRKVAEHLDMDLGDFPDLQIEWPINDWLCQNGKHDIKAAVVKWPQHSGKLGVVFISKFVTVDWEDHILKESAKDLEVKRWLEGLGAEGLQWASMLDTFGITLDGLEPQTSGLRFKEVSLEDMLAGFKNRHLRY
jgi:hypothetical protein